MLVYWFSSRHHDEPHTQSYERKKNQSLNGVIIYFMFFTIFFYSKFFVFSLFTTTKHSNKDKKKHTHKEKYRIVLDLALVTLSFYLKSRLQLKTFSFCYLVIV